MVNSTLQLLLFTGFQYYSDSPFGRPHNFTIFFSSVMCTGNEERVTDCAKNNLTFEEGRKLVNHIGLAGVSCKPHCPALTLPACPSVTPLADISTQFITKTITAHACSRIIEIWPSQQVQTKTITAQACSRTIGTWPSQQVQPASNSSSTDGHVTTTFLLAGISGTLTTVTVTLAVG